MTSGTDTRLLASGHTPRRVCRCHDVHCAVGPIHPAQAQQDERAPPYESGQALVPISLRCGWISAAAFLSYRVYLQKAIGSNSVVSLSACSRVQVNRESLTSSIKADK